MSAIAASASLRLSRNDSSTGVFRMATVPTPSAIGARGGSTAGMPCRRAPQRLRVPRIRKRDKASTTVLRNSS
jgi:hypothetical protein